MFGKLTKHGFYLATSTNASATADRVKVYAELSSRIKHGGAVGYLAATPRGGKNNEVVVGAVSGHVRLSDDAPRGVRVPGRRGRG